MLSLFDLILTILATSTACEGRFSHMKVIKSDKGTLMKEATLSNSMMTKLEGPSIKQFNPDAAIDLWFNRCPRRPATWGFQENKSGWCQISVIINTEIKSFSSNIFLQILLIMYPCVWLQLSTLCLKMCLKI